MSPHKLFCLLSGILCGICLLVECASAGDLSANAPVSTPSLQVKLVNESPTWPPILHAYLTVGTNKLSFRLPDSFRMDASISTQDTISLVNSEDNCWLTFRIVGPQPPGGKELKSQSLRELLLNQHPGAKVLEEFSLIAAGQDGPAFDLQWETSSGVIQRMRVMFITSSAGVLELDMLTNAENVQKFQGAFDVFRLSLSTSVDDARPETVPFHNNTV